MREREKKKTHIGDVQKAQNIYFKNPAISVSKQICQSGQNTNHYDDIEEIVWWERLIWASPHSLIFSPYLLFHSIRQLSLQFK